MKKITAAMLPLILGMAGCTLYTPKPLATTPSLLRDLPHLVAKADRQPLPDLASHPVNPDHGLDMTEVEMLAVTNNPDLKVVRDERGIAAAQLMAAGILPNPQLTAGLDHPTSSGPGLVNAFNFGLSYDVGSLITRNASIGAADSAARKVDWSVLCQEWQVVQKARLLFIQIASQEKIRQQLQEYRSLLADRYQRSSQALAAGNLTADATSASLAELQVVSSRLNELERRDSQSRHDLNALLGLTPEINLNLTGQINLPKLSDAEVAVFLKELPQRRPDLLALQAGYASQEEQFRQAVLAQFPALNIGLTRARDTSGINTTGLGVTLTLPFFDRNQGNIAIARATRQHLRDEYQARLDAAYGEAASLEEQIRLATEQHQATTAALPELESILKRARSALDAGNMEFATFAGLQASLFEKRLEALALEQSILEQRAILQTLVGSDFSMQTVAPHIRREKEGRTQ